MRPTSVAGFDWDDGNWPKCGKHGVSREEIESVFALDPRIENDAAHSSAERRLRVIGPTSSGRFVFLVVTLRRREAAIYIRPISARFMHRKEIEHYERG